MAIKEFEFMHGGVITRLLRKDIPLQLTLVETSSGIVLSSGVKFVAQT
jgi:hypothetical protein